MEEDALCEANNCLRPKYKTVHWIQCDSCDKWLHMVCCGLSNKKKKIPSFFCPTCNNLRNKLQNSETFPSEAVFKECIKKVLPTIISSNLKNDNIYETLSQSKLNHEAIPKLYDYMEKQFCKAKKKQSKKNAYSIIFWETAFQMAKDETTILLIKEIFLYSSPNTICQVPAQTIYRTLIHLVALELLLNETDERASHTTDNVDRTQSDEVSTHMPLDNNKRNLTPDEEMGLRHTAGAVIAGVLRVLRRDSCSSNYANFHAAVVKNDNLPHEETENFTAAVSRGKLIRITDFCFNFFIQLHQIAVPFYTDFRCQNRKKKALVAVYSNDDISKQWNTMGSSLTNKGETFNKLLLSFLLNMGNSFSRRLKEKNDTKTRKGARGIRKTLASIGNV